ncbi:unnamed protein product [Arabis nemorensis]|uniref:Uncharacterized protein n=1 Tax=Arabis nemorensis TaxID=586526 RepID=A0A565BY98_9BRAS|nr:unnamed protein product [Arabis nemorensis]
MEDNGGEGEGKSGGSGGSGGSEGRRDFSSVARLFLRREERKLRRFEWLVAAEGEGGETAIESVKTVAGDLK